jgi:hypothetical protein
LQLFYITSYLHTIYCYYYLQSASKINENRTKWVDLINNGSYVCNGLLDLDLYHLGDHNLFRAARCGRGLYHDHDLAGRDYLDRALVLDADLGPGLYPVLACQHRRLDLVAAHGLNQLHVGRNDRRGGLSYLLYGDCCARGLDHGPVHHCRVPLHVGEVSVTHYGSAMQQEK